MLAADQTDHHSAATGSFCWSCGVASHIPYLSFNATPGCLAPSIMDSAFPLNSLKLNPIRAEEPGGPDLVGTDLADFGTRSD